jgi:hypothetical protein
MRKTLFLGDRRLRLSVLLACWAEAAFIVFIVVFLLKHSDPLGDGMEMVFVGFAFMLIFFAVHGARAHSRAKWTVPCAGHCPRSPWRGCLFRRLARSRE